jgi:hypothetical protein
MLFVSRLLLLLQQLRLLMLMIAFVNGSIVCDFEHRHLHESQPCESWTTTISDVGKKPHEFLRISGASGYLPAGLPAVDHSNGTSLGNYMQSSCV